MYALLSIFALMVSAVGVGVVCNRIDGYTFTPISLLWGLANHLPTTQT